MTKLMQGPIFFHIKRRLFLECNRWTYLQTRLWWTLFTSFRYQDSQSSLCTVVVLVREEHLLLSESCLHVWVSVCLWERSFWIAAMPMSLGDNPGHWCSETNRAEMICPLLTTNKKRRDLVFVVHLQPTRTRLIPVYYCMERLPSSPDITLISAWTFLC